MSRLTEIATYIQREAKSRVNEKKPPKAAINLGTDVDAPWGEKTHAANLPGSVLGCIIEADFCNQTSSLQHLSSSTRFADGIGQHLNKKIGLKDQRFS